MNGATHLVQAEQQTKLRTRECASLSDAVLCATDPAGYFSQSEQKSFTRVKEKVRMTRYGGDCYIFALLAMGFRLT